MTPEAACFVPLSAPSAFCWRRTSDATVDATVEVAHRWTDAQGAAQKSTVTLRRL